MIHVQLDTTGGINPRTHTFFAPTEVEREEWVHVIRKHAVNSVIDNGYTIRRDDKESKLGSGSYSTVWKGVCRDTKKVWAIKEMQKSAVKKEEVSFRIFLVWGVKRRAVKEEWVM